MRLFPGVRLNFSRGGISTTVGVRGASMTLGGKGAHVNLGIPGSGLAYRQRVAPPLGSGRPGAASPAAPPPRPPPEFGGAYIPEERLIRSAEVSALTTPGLGELKRLINEAQVRRNVLISVVSGRRRALAKAQGRLQLAQAFIIRLFTAKAVPGLAEAAQAAEDQLDQSQAELAGCFIEIDFGFDDATLNSYAALIRSFEALSSCSRIWDVTSTRATNRIAERTVAHNAVSRAPVSFELTSSAIVKSKHQVLGLGNVGGRDLQIFPGFIMMRDATQDFGLVEFHEFTLTLSRTHFVEEQQVPVDAKVVGQTWKKANKDGSPDRRFKENYSIPLVEYGELTMTSTTGLLEAYQFSDFAKTEAFAQAFAVHERALAALAKTGSPVAAADPSDADDQPLGEDDAGVERSSIVVTPPAGLWLDWAALAFIVIGLGAGGVWVAAHPASAAPPPAVIAPASSAAPPPSAAGDSKPAHRRRHRHTPTADQT